MFDYDFNQPKVHVVHNDAEKTPHGVMRAFRIAMEGMSKQLLPPDLGSETPVSWARHQLVVTRHKDDEWVSSSPYGMWDSANVVTNFTSFYEDDEDIVDEDLVFWITEGMHHIPHTEDLPVTPTVGNHLTFFLLPYNYFRQCPSMTSSDHIRVEHKDKSEPSQGVRVLRSGDSQSQCSLPPTAREYDELLEVNPDVVLESRGSRGIL